jgi:HD-GYP domain-containing protein (c-di-GMP phosphodiesterase class II)
MQHTVVGEHILRPLMSDRADVLGVVRWHHERPDGTGFPDGLRGEETPIAARVIGVADAYDAMTSARPYRSAPLSREQALAELREGAGEQFDEECVMAFIKEFGEDGEAGAARSERPVVRHAAERSLRLVHGAMPRRPAVGRLFG